jgi:DNA-binding NarL/FixJ family response regulator
MTRKILVVDDNPLIRNVIRSSIEQRTTWRICGEAENGQEAIAKVEELNPDVVILDLHMPVMNGLMAAEHISRIAPKLPILMFTTHKSEEVVRVAQAAGVKSVLAKDSRAPDDELISAIRDIFNPESSISPE